MDYMLAIIKITGISGQEIRYINIEMNLLHTPWKIINEGERYLNLVCVIDTDDYELGIVDRYLKHWAHDIVSRYRTMTKINKDSAVPFTRHCEFYMFPDATIPIDYTVEYRTYDKEYITDDILEELKNETK